MKFSARIPQKLKFFFHLCLSLVFFIIALDLHDQYQKKESLTISTLSNLPDEINEFKITICPTQAKRIENDSLESLEPGYTKHMENYLRNENSTFYDIEKFLKPTDQFIKRIDFGFPTKM